MPTIRMKNVAKLYKDKDKKLAAVSNINLKVEQGEFVFVLGSRGAGKSTLLGMMCGDIVPEKGAVYLNNVNLARAPLGHKAELKRNFGRVWQESRLVRTITVFENLYPSVQTGVFKRKAVEDPLVTKALGLIGMAGCEDEYPAQLSISECRKIELAKAILHSPPILILDELTDRLDNDSIWDIMHLLSELNRRGTTIIMSTKASQFVNIMRRRVITLVDGKVIGDVKKGKFGDII